MQHAKCTFKENIKRYTFYNTLRKRFLSLNILYVVYFNFSPTIYAINFFIQYYIKQEIYRSAQ